MDKISLNKVEDTGYIGISKALYQFVAQFGTAYRGVAPQGAELPYIIYDMAMTDFAEQTPFALNVYADGIVRTKASYVPIDYIVDSITSAIPSHGSIVIPIEKGNIIISRGSPFVQDKNIEDINTKGAYINLTIMTNTTG